MGLLEALGLRSVSGGATSSGRSSPAPGAASRSGAGPPAPPGGRTSADPSDDPVIARHDRIAKVIGGIRDEKVRDSLDAELATLRATHAKARSITDAGKRETLLKAELAAAERLDDKVKKIAAQDQQEVELSNARADVEAVVSQITLLVLGGLNDDAIRKRINADFDKLKATQAKANKITDPKAALTALNAALSDAQNLLTRAQGTKDALDLSEANIAPVTAIAQAAISAMEGPAKAVLLGELDTLKADSRRYTEAADSTSLRAIVVPRLKKLSDVTSGLGKASTQIDADLGLAAERVQALDPAASADLVTRLKTLQNQKKTAWPGGSSLDEIAASIEATTAAVKTLIANAEAMRDREIIDKQMVELQKQLDALKPRIDRASETPVPAYIEQRQKNVQRLVAILTSQLADRHKNAAQSLASLRLALDDTEKFKALYAAHMAKLNAAKNGPIRAVMSLKLAPPGLAAARDKAMADREAEIEALTVDGVFGQADAEINRWIVEARAWDSAKKAYDSLHGKDPDAGTLEDLVNVPGGGAALDALVADMPTDKTPPTVFITAMKARYGVEVEQFEHRKDGGKSEDPDTKTRLDPTKPDPDQEKDLQGLYKVLGKVPVKDVKYVDKINRFTKDKESATYTGGIFTDTIALHCGRPGDTDQTPFDSPGVVVPIGEKVQPGCEPAKPGDTAPYFDFTVLHEVGHAVDDARGVMSGGRDKDAGWDTHGTGAVAKKISAQVHFDVDYIEDMLDDKASTPPKHKPKLPKGWKQADWDKARDKAEKWVTAIRVDKKLWDDAAGAKAHSIDGYVYHEAYDGQWVSYRYAARAQGVTGYQFRAPAEWFAELYATFHTGKLNPKHPAAPWLQKLKAESKSAS